MPFEDYTQLVDPLVLPIAGKKYTIPQVSAKDGLRYVEARKPGSETSLTDQEVFDIFLGSVYQEMLDDSVPAEALGRALYTAMAEFELGRPTAEVMWATGADPKALSELQAIPPTTGAADTTKQLASTNGTKSRKK